MRRYVAFAAALLLLLLGSQAVLAQYGPSGPLTVSNANPAAGAQITVSAVGFAPSSPVQITIESSSSAPALLATANTDATGAFSKSVTIPASTAGHYTLSARGTDTSGSVLVLTASIEVAAGEVAGVTSPPTSTPPVSDVAGVTSPPTSTTPVSDTGRSGSDVLVIAIAGAGIVLMTGILMLVTNKSRSLR